MVDTLKMIFSNCFASISVFKNCAKQSPWRQQHLLFSPPQIRHAMLVHDEASDSWKVEGVTLNAQENWARLETPDGDVLLHSYDTVSLADTTHTHTHTHTHRRGLLGPSVMAGVTLIHMVTKFRPQFSAALGKEFQGSSVPISIVLVMTGETHPHGH